MSASFRTVWKSQKAANYVEWLIKNTPFAVSIAEDRAHTGCMGHETVAALSAWKEKRNALKKKRDALFSEYTKRPEDCHLSLEIKKIDDEVAECNRKEQEGNERSKVRRPPTLVSS